MTLDHRDPALPEQLADAKRAVLDYAEAVTLSRQQGTLTAAALDRLAEANDRLRDLRLRHIAGTPPP